MSLDKPNTLDGHEEHEEMVPGYHHAEPPPDGEPRRRGWLWAVILVLVILVGLYVYRSYSNSLQAAKSAGAKSGQGGGGIPVVAATVRTGDIGVYFTGLGAVTPIYTVTVRSQIAGYLMQVLYQEGQTVHKGDALAEIDPRPYQVMLEQAEAGMARDQSTLENAKVDLQRYQTLAPLKAIPEQQLATQAATVKSDEGTIKTDQAQIDNAKLDLVYCHIIAPITGRVGLRLVDPGNYVAANDSNGLVVITQVQPISVIFTLPEDQLPAVVKKLHAGARLQVDAYDREMKTKIGEGSLATLDNQIDPTTGTVKLRANFSNSDGALFPNQFINARLLVEEKHGVNLIPTAAIQRNGQETYVYLVVPGAGNKGEGTVTIRKITTGTSEGDDAEVTSGLNAGDQVVMTGVDKLQEGTKVRVTPAGGKGSRGGS